MKKTLLLISQERDKEAAIAHALDVTENSPEAELFIFYIMDERFSRKYESMLSESTFVADKPGEDICHALKEEYHARAEKTLHTIKARCEASHITCTTGLRSGDYYDVAKELCREINPELVVVSERQNSFMARAVGFSDKRRLAKLTGAVVKAF